MLNTYCAQWWQCNDDNQQLHDIILYPAITLFNDFLQMNIETNSILLPPLLHLQHNDNDSGTSQPKFRCPIITRITIVIHDRKKGKKPNTIKQQKGGNRSRGSIWEIGKQRQQDCYRFTPSVKMQTGRMCFSTSNSLKSKTKGFEKMMSIQCPLS